jgi:TldD protein
MDELAALQYAMDLRARYAEVRWIESRGREIILKNGNLDATGFIDSKGISIRVLANGFGFASTDILDREHIKKGVESAIRSAKGQRRMAKWEDVEGEKFKEEVRPKKPLDRLAALRDLDSKISDFCPFRFFALLESNEEKRYVNSDGAQIHTKIPRLHLFSLITVGAEGLGFEQFNEEFGGVGGTELLKDWDFEDVMEKRAKQVLKTLKERKSPPKGRVDYVLGPKISGIAAHESCGHPFEADRILGREMAQAGGSFLSGGELGTRIGSDSASVIDDPTLDGSFGYYRYDDEGVKARKRYLIKNGIIDEYLQNRETSLQFGGKSNGSARASEYDREPLVRMANTYIEPGDYSFDELIEDVKLGIFMKSFMEWNIDDKRLNQKYTASEAYLIKDGELTSTVYRPVLEITTHKFYSSIDACSKDLEFTAAMCGKGEPMQEIPVFTGGPYIRLRGQWLR